MMNNQQKQQLTNSILNQVRKGQIEVKLYDFHYKVVKDEEIQALCDSLLEWGQIDPIYVAIEDLESSEPIVRVVKGNKLLRAIYKLRAEGKWDKSILVKLFKDSDSDIKSPAAFFAASNFVRSNYSTMQKGVYAGVLICPGLRAQGRANQAAQERIATRVNTSVDAGKMVGVNAKAVKFGEELVKLNTWFYTYIWEYQNDMPTRDVKELLKMNIDPIKQRAIIDKMKELYEEDVAKAAKVETLNNKPKRKKKSEDVQKTPLEKLYDDPEEKELYQLLNSNFDESGKTLFERAKCKVKTDTLVGTPDHAMGKVLGAMGRKKPSKKASKKEVKASFLEALEDAFEQEKPVEYVKQHGTGSNRVDLDFPIPKDLAEIVRSLFEDRGINVTIYSNPPCEYKEVA